MGMSREEAIDMLVKDKEQRGECFISDALDMAIKALEQLPTTKNDLGVDAVSRQEVLDLIADYDLSMGQVVRGIHALPSVTPIRPKGHWMGGSYDYVCSNCEHSLNDLAQSMDYIPFSKPKYCPNCGCRMVEPQESEERTDD